MTLDVRHCEVCGYKMTPLFISYACDKCDGLLGNKKHTDVNAPYGTYGYITYVSNTKIPFVFERPDQVDKWLTEELKYWEELKGAVSRTVEFLKPINWKECTSYDPFTQGHFFRWGKHIPLTKEEANKYDVTRRFYLVEE